MSDQLVTLLNRFGYQPIVLPRTELTPPELYNFVKPKLIRRGPLGDFMKEASNLEVTKGRLANLEGHLSSDKHFNAAVDFLSAALASLGISSIPKLELGFTGSKDFVFSFTNVTYRAVDPTKIDNVLQKLQVPPAIPDKYVTEGVLHLAYEYAYSTSLQMSRADQKQFSVDVSGKIGEFINLGAGGKAESHDNTIVSFSTTDTFPAAFAYRAGRLHKVSDTRWTFEPEVVMRGHKAIGETAVPPTYLPAHGVVLRVEGGEDISRRGAA
jgi:hypothetical protein